MPNKKSITPRVKTFEEACTILGLEPGNLPIVDTLPEKDRKSIIAYYKLTIIIRALNEGWEPDLTDWIQEKYWNFFYITDEGATEGFGYADSGNEPWGTGTDVGSRLCFRTRELAEYAFENFQDLYFEYLFIDIPKNYKQNNVN